MGHRRLLTSSAGSVTTAKDELIKEIREFRDPLQNDHHGFRKGMIRSANRVVEDLEEQRRSPAMSQLGTAFPQGRPLGTDGSTRVVFLAGYLFLADYLRDWACTPLTIAFTACPGSWNSPSQDSPQSIPGRTLVGWAGLPPAIPGR